MAAGSTLGEWYNFAALALPDLAPQPASIERFQTGTSAFFVTTGQQLLPIIFFVRLRAILCDEPGCEMWRRSFLIVFLSIAASLPAWAFERPFPQNAKRGTMTPDTYPQVVIDGKARQLSAGSRIWNQHNRIEMPAYLQGSELTVNYTENAQGEIDRVWILTDDEARQPPPAPTNDSSQ
jgi:hypothetical protein